jgi:hypothetical protein
MTIIGWIIVIVAALMALGVVLLIPIAWHDSPAAHQDLEELKREEGDD